MVHRIRTTRLFRIAVALAWTLALAAGLYVVDRGFLGSRAARGWVQVPDLADIPAAAGPIVVPAYFPDTLTWPPAEVWVRLTPGPGWWLGVRARDTGRVVLWIGSGAAPAPTALADVGLCLREPGHAGCPPGWRQISKSLDGNRVVFVVTSLESAVAARVLEGLSLAR